MTHKEQQELLLLCKQAAISEDVNMVCAWIKQKTREAIDKKMRKPVHEDTERLYKLYPSKCPKRNSTTGKSKKNYTQLSSLIYELGVSQTEFTITNYIKDCKDNGVYMKNFGTFLNNFPDTPIETPKEKDKEVSFIMDGKICKGLRSKVPANARII